MSDIRHVAQRGPMDCSIACAAMIAEIPYEIALQRSPAICATKGALPLEVIVILEATTGVSWRNPKFGWYRPIAKLTPKEYPILVVIRQPWKWRTLHCVVVAGEFVHDPQAQGPIRISEYWRKQWRVIHTYHPTHPERLIAVRHFYQEQRPVDLSVVFGR